MASSDEVDVGERTFWICPVCACVVQERARHQKWHRDRGDVHREAAVSDQFAPYVD